MTINNNPQRRTMSIEEAARYLGVSRGVAYKAARLFLDSDGAEGLPVLLLGARRLVVPVARLEDLLGCSLDEDEGTATVVDLHPVPNSETEWRAWTLAPTGTDA